MKKIVTWAVNNSPAMNTLMVAVLGVGALCAFTLRRESFPQFELDYVLITVVYPGASPAEVEEGICLKIEEAIRGIEGIKKLETVSREGSGFGIAEIDPNARDVQTVVNDIRSEVDRIPSFPETAEDPEIKQVTLRSPAIRLSVIGGDRDDPEMEWKLRQITEDVRNELLQIPTITNVDLQAVRPYQIDVEISEETLRAHELTLQQVAEIIRKENLEVPAGNIQTRSTTYLVRGKNKYLTGKKIAEIPILTQPNGAVLRVGDLGTVRDGFEDQPIISEVDGQPGMVMVVNKTDKEDLLEIVQAVNDYAATKVMPPGYELRVWGSEWRMVRDRLDLLTRSGISGLILVFIVLALFLEIRLAFWVALGIPIAVFGTCAVMYFSGATLNMISMFAFVLALGIVVDDAIVVGENVYKHRQMGKPAMKAAIDGTVEVGPSVIASVTTTIIAFVPLLCVSGVMGKFIAVMPMAVISMLAISILESLFVLPCHLRHSSSPETSWYRRWLGSRNPLRLLVEAFLFAFNRARGYVSRGLEWFVEHYYLPSLQWGLNRPALAISSALSMLVLSFGLVVGGFTPWSVFPTLDMDTIVGKIVYPNGTPKEVLDRATQRMEEAARHVVADYEAAGTPILNTIFRSVGDVRGQDGNWEDRSGGHVGQVTMDMIPSDERQVKSTEIIRKWREALGEVAGAEKVTFGGPRIGPGGQPIEFKLVGEDLDRLDAAANKVKERLRSYPGVFDVADSYEPGKWELQLNVREDAKMMGQQMADLADTVRATYYGDEVMRLQRGRHEIKLMVRYPKEERESLANFEEIRVRTDEGDEIPLQALADVKVDRGPAAISRIDQLRAITITADVDEDTANASEVVADLKKSFMPGLFEEFPGMGVRWEGQQQQSDESIASLMIGFLIAAFVMFSLLTLEFRSYTQPAIVMAVIPFGAIGAILGHLCLGLPITMFSLFGMVALAGVVVNDSIVLIDFINHRREGGMTMREALLDAGRRRVRPILLTSITTVAGLLPILLERSIQAQILIPMAVSVSFGLMLGTIWVLIMVPIFYQTCTRVTDMVTPDEHEHLPAEPMGASV
ncbi:Multidrug resistance protein MdtC [Planctomycetes bacterium Pan216]|uniref:Multidrug resistance protein MdtC n=1 Tax=Kolteria novifilia TaxID=2527975 RepID=A0A518BBQ7_9BACT|nr:Multidrug resistance protein MdtC [Planctomycetes bacterium Pan216]